MSGTRKNRKKCLLRIHWAFHHQGIIHTVTLAHPSSSATLSRLSHKAVWAYSMLVKKMATMRLRGWMLVNMVHRSQDLGVTMSYPLRGMDSKQKHLNYPSSNCGLVQSSQFVVQQLLQTCAPWAGMWPHGNGTVSYHDLCLTIHQRACPQVDP